jgi:hypothetical protein
MKMSLLFAGLIVISSSVFAGELDGKTFCRTVVRDGMFGQPKREAQHCVSFKENTMKDNADTFFGNPPSSLKYVLASGKILVVNGGNLESPYSVDESFTQLSNSVGTVLVLK